MFLLAMIRKKLQIILFILVGIVSINSLSAKDCFPDSPNQPRLVNDFAKVFNSNQSNKMEKELRIFNNETSTQIVVLTILDLCGYDPSSYAYQIGEQWGVGDAKFNNGVVVLLKPKTSSSKGEVFIATGYGLEGALPDAFLKRLVSKEMIPHFKNNDYFTGVSSALNVIMEVSRGEYTADSYHKKSKKSIPVFPIIFLFFAILFMIVRFASNAKHYAKTNNLGFWAAFWLLNSSSNRHHGRYQNFRSGNGGFGNFGGGGFGGFGGGSFGGGGAGGSW